MNYNYENKSRDQESNNFNNMSRVIKKNNNTRVKPKFFKLMGQIMNYHIDV